MTGRRWILCCIGTPQSRIGVTLKHDISLCQAILLGPRWALSWKPKQLRGVMKVRDSTSDIASSQGESYLDFLWSFKWYLIKNQAKLPAVVTLLYCGTSANQLLYQSRVGSVYLGVVQCKAPSIPFSLLSQLCGWLRNAFPVPSTKVFCSIFLLHHRRERRPDVMINLSISL